MSKAEVSKDYTPKQTIVRYFTFAMSNCAIWLIRAIEL